MIRRMNITDNLSRQKEEEFDYNFKIQNNLFSKNVQAFQQLRELTSPQVNFHDLYKMRKERLQTYAQQNVENSRMVFALQNRFKSPHRISTGQIF